MKIDSLKDLQGFIKQYHPSVVFITMADLERFRAENLDIGYWMLNEPNKLGFNFCGANVYCKDYQPPIGTLDLTGDEIKFDNEPENPKIVDGWCPRHQWCLPEAIGKCSICKSLILQFFRRTEALDKDDELIKILRDMKRT